jgi:hypothetical protein
VTAIDLSLPSTRYRRAPSQKASLVRYDSNLLYEIGPTDPMPYLGVSALVFAITMIASWVPARRAQRVDPVAVLRNE